MGSVASQLTRIHDVEGSLTLNNLPSGGPSAAANTDVFLQAAQSAGKRLSNVTVTGFLNQDAADNDVSAADVHVGLWVWVTHFASLTELRLVFAAGTGTPTSYDAHTFPLSEYPKLGGWVRAWADVSRTPENTGTTGLNEALLRQVGVQVSLPTVGGTSPNVIFDAHDYTDGTAALDLTGTSGVWADFSTADENANNQYGVFRLIGGVYNCFARVQLGTDASLVFDDSNFTIVFPQQALVADTFMGITADLQHANTDIAWENGVIRSGGAKLGDLVVVGTAGVFAATGMALGNLRVVTLTSACALTGCAISGSGLITAAGASLLGCTISGATGAVALLWNVATNPNGKLDNTDFQSGGSGHAIELGPNTPDQIALFGVTFSGYGADDTANAAIFNNSGKHLEISILGSGSVPTVLNGGGASTDVITGQRNLSFSVVDLAGAAVTGYEWRLYDATGAPAGQFGTELDGEESATESSQNYAYTYVGDTPMKLQVLHNDFKEAVLSSSLIDADRDLSVVLIPEENV